MQPQKMVNPRPVRNGSKIQALDSIFPSQVHLSQEEGMQKKKYVTCFLHTYYQSKSTTRSISEKTTKRSQEIKNIWVFQFCLSRLQKLQVCLHYLIKNNHPLLQITCQWHNMNQLKLRGCSDSSEQDWDQKKQKKPHQNQKKLQQ